MCELQWCRASLRPSQPCARGAACSALLTSSSRLQQCWRTQPLSSSFRRPHSRLQRCVDCTSRRINRCFQQCLLSASSSSFRQQVCNTRGPMLILEAAREQLAAKVLLRGGSCRCCSLTTATYSGSSCFLSNLGAAHRSQNVACRCCSLTATLQSKSQHLPVGQVTMPCPCPTSLRSESYPTFALLCCFMGPLYQCLAMYAVATQAGPDDLGR